MKLKIKIRRLNKNIPFPKVIGKGEWIDLRASEEVRLKAPEAGVLSRHTIDKEVLSYRKVTFDTKLIGLGIAVELPKGFEAVIAPRSSTYKYFGVGLANSIGIIDNSYSGNNDEWKFSAIALDECYIREGDRICQFRIQLSQKATIWQKIKWLFSSGIRLVEVTRFNNNNRGGIGSTGINSGI